MTTTLAHRWAMTMITTALTMLVLSASLAAGTTAAPGAPSGASVARPGHDEIGIKGHGFVRDNNVFTTIDAPGAGLYTVASTTAAGRWAATSMTEEDCMVS
jgi:hypothetical protein